MIMASTAVGSIMAPIPQTKSADQSAATRGLGFRYAVCNDGKVLSRGQVTGWQISRYTPDQIAEFVARLGIPCGS